MLRGALVHAHCLRGPRNLRRRIARKGLDHEKGSQKYMQDKREQVSAGDPSG